MTTQCAQCYNSIACSAHFGEPDLVPANGTTHWFRALSNKSNSFLREESVCVWNSRWHLNQFFYILIWEKLNKIERQMETVFCLYLAQEPIIHGTHVSVHLSITLSDYLFYMSIQHIALGSRNSISLGKQTTDLFLIRLIQIAFPSG